MVVVVVVVGSVVVVVVLGAGNTKPSRASTSLKIQFVNDLNCLDIIEFFFLFMNIVAKGCLDWIYNCLQDKMGDIEVILQYFLDYTNQYRISLLCSSVKQCRFSFFNSHDYCWFGALVDATILLWKGNENKTKFLFKMHFGV